MNLVASHGQRLEDEHAKVSALQIEREVREKVIESLHGEAMKRMRKSKGLKKLCGLGDMK